MTGFVLVPLYLSLYLQRFEGRCYFLDEVPPVKLSSSLSFLPLLNLYGVK